MTNNVSGANARTPRTGVTRRSFVKGGGVLAGAAALSAAFGAAGAAMADTSEETGEDQSERANDFDVFDSEVLVLGGGMAGCLAALQAYKEGCQVTLVDKGPFRASGASGLNWDAGTSGPPTEAPSADNLSGVFPGSGIWNDTLANKKLSAKAVEWTGSNIETWNRILAFCRMGNTCCFREEDGSLENRGGVQASVQMLFTRHPSEYLYTQTNVDIFDQTMITGLFVVDGKCMGAVGIHLPTGRYRVFRAKATIIANGGSTQMYGWSGTGAISINSPDNTGDVDMAAFRNGCSIINPELFSYDMISRFPGAFGGSFCSGLGADSVSSSLICDSNGDYIFTIEKEEGAYGPITVECSLAILDGRGSENDCLYLDLSKSDAESLTRPAYSRNIRLWKEVLGIDVTAPGYKVEISVEPFEHMGNPVIDENGMTELSGLFNVRGIGNFTMLLGSQWIVPYIAHCAAEYAFANDSYSNDWTSVKAELARLETILSNEGDIRPHEIRHSIQRAFFDAMHVGANAEGLNAAIAEIRRIKEEDFPRMAVSNKTKCFNTDWRKAIENYNLIDAALMALEGTLMREETRIFYFRSDFPQIDNENWQANILVSYNNGDFEYTKRPVVQA